MKITYLIHGLDCANCAVEVERALSRLDGVTSCSVAFSAQRVIVEYEGDKSPQQLKDILEAEARRTEGGVSLLDPQEARQADLKKSLLSPHNIANLCGLALFVLAVVLEETEVLTDYYRLILFVPAYLLAGYDIVFRCVKNIARGRFFDENFLMTLVTIGAFVLGEYLEAVCVMLFYQLGEFFNRLAAQRSRNAVRALIYLSQGGEDAEKTIDTVENASGQKSKSEQFVTRFSRVYTPIVVAIALVVAFIVPLFRFFGALSWQHLQESITSGLLILLVSCPCALVLSIPMSYFGGLGAASKRGILLLGGNHLDTMCRLKTVVISDSVKSEGISQELSSLGVSVLRPFTADDTPEVRRQAVAKLCSTSTTAYVGADEIDVPALKAANVGIAPSKNCSIAATASADIVIGDDPAKIATTIRIAKRVRLLVTINIVFILLVKLTVMALSMSSILTNLLLAEVADVGVAVVATLISMTILKYTPKPRQPHHHHEIHCKDD